VETLPLMPKALVAKRIVDLAETVSAQCNNHTEKRRSR